jgi:hypothetical protein
LFFTHRILKRNWFLKFSNVQGVRLHYLRTVQGFLAECFGLETGLQ